ncbi:hypothetical protein DSECCO2_522930 [anaerobic digester metagenome]
MFDVKTFSFGILVNMPSYVLTTVERIRISSTLPLMPATLMLSPILMGCSNMRKRPETRFETTLWLANPMTRPTMPPATRRPERSNWSCGRAMTSAPVTMM